VPLHSLDNFTSQWTSQPEIQGPLTQLRPVAPLLFGSLARLDVKNIRSTPLPEPQAYGIIRETLGESATETSADPPSFRLVLVAFEVRMWRIFDWPRLNLPEPVLWKRFAAPECVFSFGMCCSLVLHFGQPTESTKDSRENLRNEVGPE